MKELITAWLTTCLRYEYLYQTKMFIMAIPKFFNLRMIIRFLTFYIYIYIYKHESKRKGLGDYGPFNLISDPRKVVEKSSWKAFPSTW